MIEWSHMVTTDIAGRFLLVFREQLPDGRVNDVVAGVYNDRWLAFQNGFRHPLNSEKPGKVMVFGFDFATLGDSSEYWDKLTTFSVNHENALIAAKEKLS